MAIYYKRSTAGTADWNLATSWSTVSSTVATNTGTFPVSGDIVRFDSSSGPTTVTSGAKCSELNFNYISGYANTITFTNSLTVDMNSTLGLGDITFSAAVGFSMAGPNGIIYNNLIATISTRTLTTNGYNYNLPFTVSGASVGSTLNLVGNLQVTNYTGLTGSFNFTGSELRVSGNWSGSAQGTSLKVLNGTGNMATGSTVQYLVVNAPTFTRTFTGTSAVTTSFVHTAGTISATGSTINFNGVTLDLNGQTLNNLIMSFGGTTVSVPTSVILTGNLQLPNGTSAVNGTGGISVAGNLTNNGTTGGSCVITMNGTGSISGAAYGNTIIVNTSGIISIGTPCSVNTFTLTAGTLNLANGLNINGGTFSIAIGFNFTGLSNLTITANTASITSNGVSWPTSVIMANAANLATVITINDNLTVTGSFTSSSIQSNTVTLNGGPLNVNGNLTVNKAFSGSATINLIGSAAAAWSGTANNIQNSIVVNKSGGAVVTVGAGNITWGGNSKILTMTSTVDFTTNLTTFILTGTPLTINNSSSSQFYNMTVPAGTTLNIN